MRDGLTFKLLLLVSLVLTLWSLYTGSVLTVNARQSELTTPTLPPQAVVYLPLVFKNYIYSPVTPGATATPAIGCAPQRLGDIPVGFQPRSLAVDEARTRVYVANYAGASVSIIYGHANTVIQTVTNFPAISAPTGIAYDSATDTIWVANSGSNSSGNFYWLAPIRADDFTVGPTIPISGEPWGVAFNPVDKYVYVTILSDNSVSVISPGLSSVINTIGVGQRPYNLAVHRKTGWVYVANFGSQSVSVLNATGLLRPDIPLDFGSGEPFGIAIDDVLNNYVYVTTVKSYRIETIDINNNHRLLPWHKFKRLNGRGAPLRALALNMTLDTADGGHLWTTTSTGDMSDFTQVLLIPKGYVSGFNLPIPDDYDDLSGGGLLGAGLAVDTVIDRTYVSLPASDSVRVYGDRNGSCVKPFVLEGDIMAVPGP